MLSIVSIVRIVLGLSRIRKRFKSAGTAETVETTEDHGGRESKGYERGVSTLGGSMRNECGWINGHTVQADLVIETAVITGAGSGAHQCDGLPAIDPVTGLFQALMDVPVTGGQPETVVNDHGPNKPPGGAGKIDHPICRGHHRCPFFVCQFNAFMKFQLLAER